VCFVDPHNKTTYSTETYVARHKKKGTVWFGLPCILPNKVKNVCVATRIGVTNGSLPRVTLLQFKLIITMLSFFRATSPK
jgi:hypothetical protein